MELKKAEKAAKTNEQMTTMENVGGGPKVIVTTTEREWERGRSTNEGKIDTVEGRENDGKRGTVGTEKEEGMSTVVAETETKRTTVGPETENTRTEESARTMASASTETISTNAATIVRDGASETEEKRTTPITITVRRVGTVLPEGQPRKNEGTIGTNSQKEGWTDRKTEEVCAFMIDD